MQSTGDGIFALFGAPIAHEDHPQRALHAALRMQQEIRRYGDQLLQGGGAPIEIRVGVNTGDVVMRPLKTGDSSTEYAPIGLTTNLASGMQAVARSGSVVVSEATRKLVEGYFQLKAIGPTKAYKSLLTERRKLLHERTAQAIETIYSQRLEDHYANLAYHYRSSNNAAKAVEYLRLAGEQAVDRGAYAQSRANAELALKSIERLPEGSERQRTELGGRLLEGMP